jgi:hypothetical protein
MGNDEPMGHGPSPDNSGTSADRMHSHHNVAHHKIDVWRFTPQPRLGELVDLRTSDYTATRYGNVDVPDELGYCKCSTDS